MSHRCDFLSGLWLCQGYSPGVILAVGPIFFTYVALILTIEHGSLVNTLAQGRWPLCDFIKSIYVQELMAPTEEVWCLSSERHG